MTSRNCIIFILFAFVLNLNAQSVVRNATRPSSSTQLLKQYSDSLTAYRQKLDAALAGNDSLKKIILGRDTISSLSVQAVTPLTFRHGVAQRLFGLAENDPARDYIDKVMMKMYIDHPELVKETERQLAQDGEIKYKPQEPLRPVVNLTDAGNVGAPAPNVLVEPQVNNVQLVYMKPNFWTFAGDYSLQFLQNYISGNWYKGGESSYAMIGAATIQANYNDKEKIKWDNKLELKLGMQSSQGDTLHNYKSSEDLIRLTSKLGVQATKRWYYTLQSITQTQFTRGYKSNNAMVYSDFMSPLNINVSLGMDYKVEWLKKRLTGTINISPLAANFKYVDRLSLSASNGIDEGRHSKWDLGSTFTTDVAWKFSDLVKWQTRLYAFTNYKRTQVEWENTITFQLSKYISTKIFVYPRFDDSVATRDDKLGYFQLKEYWSLGFNYGF